ncbi:unnamed protein product [Nesidiocoris tenuis]|uniref:Uncharacterized protein n=1 Tax=Nesidiocoris tenuis TaxID=355587 RepID=A0A6H5G8V8_9HEMI|nr:unnamed protein product [Nesidiocoris tenuis]
METAQYLNDRYTIFRTTPSKAYVKSKIVIFIIQYWFTILTTLCPRRLMFKEKGLQKMLVKNSKHKIIIVFMSISYIAKPVVYGRQEIEGYNLNNRGQDYKNYIEDGLARSNFKDGAILVNNGAEGVSGARALYRGNKGDQGYISDSMASK